ncbi:MAG: hypothetical protein K2N23_03975, partial [Clostridia bacterium]|nr:hypothetical protein [Clostridia bacterium]
IMERSIIDYVYETDESIYDEVKKSKEYREASERALKIYDKFTKTLTDEQKEELEKFLENEAEQEDMRVRITFRCGIKYGLRLAAECMFDN